MDPSVIIVLVLIFCLCVGVGITGFWTCTGGTWDTDKFDTSLCLKIPSSSKEKDPVVDGDDEPPPRDPPKDPGNLERSNVYSNCAGTVILNETRTCFNLDTKSAAIRWGWSSIPQAATCKSKVSKWIIGVTTSKEDHKRVRSSTVTGQNANTFGFKNAPDDMIRGHHFIFRLSPVDKDDKLVMETLEIELDATDSSKACGDQGMGNLIEWSDLVLTFDGTAPDNSLEEPSGCVGGEWNDEVPCYAYIDGVKTDVSATIHDCGPPCTRTRKRTGHTAPTGGKECITSEDYTIQRQSCNLAVLTAVDCDTGPTIKGECSKTCGGGKRTDEVEWQHPPQNNGQNCGPRKWTDIDCNTQACPIHCSGNWTYACPSSTGRCDPPCEYLGSGPGPGSNSDKTYERTYTYRVDRHAQFGGTSCPASNGEKRKSRRTQSGKIAKVRKDLCGVDLTYESPFLPF